MDEMCTEIVGMDVSPNVAVADKCQVFEFLQVLHFEPSLDSLSLQSDVISSIKILSHK